MTEKLSCAFTSPSPSDRFEEFLDTKKLLQKVSQCVLRNELDMDKATGETIEGGKAMVRYNYIA